MSLALYGEDDLGAPMSALKVRMTLDRLASEPNRGEALMIEVGSAPVGYAFLIHYWSNEYGGDIVTIDELYVEPALRDRGIGRRFIEYLEENADRDAVGLQLEVAPSNTRAIALYERLGFRRSENTALLKIFP
jgi:ribosomal protein S18 acetylase RimI-like enzyme